MKFLQQDTFLTKFLSRLIDLVTVSALWFLCSIPIITIGASTTAMYSVTLHLVFDDTLLLSQEFRKSDGRLSCFCRVRPLPCGGSVERGQLGHAFSDGPDLYDPGCMLVLDGGLHARLRRTGLV